MPSDRLAIVTGTSSGIGEALARLLLERGWRVVGLSRRPAPIDAPAYSHVEVDLADADGLTSVLTARLGALIRDPSLRRVALVNNAADPALLGQVAGLEPPGMLRAYALNTVAPVVTTGWVLTHAAASVPLRIVNVSSGAAVQAIPGLGAYGATKAALRYLGMVLAAELSAGAPAGGGRDVTVLSFEPGVVETPMARAVRDTPDDRLPSRPFFLGLAAANLLHDPIVPATSIADYLDADGHPAFKEERLDVPQPPAPGA